MVGWLYRYEYSLASFLTVFNHTLHTSKRDPTLEGRLRTVIEALTYDVYSYTCLGLFERHKLMFSFQMAIKILEGEIDSPCVLDMTDCTQRRDSASRELCNS